MPVYDAFISYSHAKDKPIAAALQSVIQKLGKAWYQRRAARVFRDDTSLSATRADFAAAIRGVPKEDLMSEEVRQQRRTRRNATGVAATLFVLAVVALWQWRTAEAEKARAETALRQGLAAESDRIAALAHQKLDEGKSALPVGLALQVAPRLKNAEDRPLTQWTTAALMRHVRALHETERRIPDGNNIFRVVTSADGQHAVTGLNNGTIQFWDADLTLRKSVTAQEDIISSLEISPDQTSVLAAGGKVPSVWDIATAEKQFDLAVPNPVKFIKMARYSPDGRLIATGGGDNRVLLFDAKDGTLLRSISGPWFEAAHRRAQHRAAGFHANFGVADPIVFAVAAANFKIFGATTDIAFSPDSKLLAVTGPSDPEGAVRFYDVETGRQVAIAVGTETNLMGGVMWYGNLLQFDASGKRLAAAALNQNIHIFETKTGKLERMLPATATSTILMDPQGQALLAGHGDGSISLWCLKERNARLRATLRGHSDNIEWLTFNAANRQFASTSSDGTAAVWSMPPMEDICPERDNEREEADKRLRAAKPIAIFEGDGEIINRSVFVDRDKSLLTASRDGTLRKWSINERGMTRLDQSENVAAPMEFTSDGASLVVSGRIWNIQSGELMAKIPEDQEDFDHISARRPDLKVGFNKSPFEVLLADPRSGVVEATSEDNDRPYISTPYDSLWQISPDGLRATGNRDWLDYFRKLKAGNETAGEFGSQSEDSAFDLNQEEQPPLLIDTTAGTMLAELVLEGYIAAAPIFSPNSAMVVSRMIKPGDRFASKGKSFVAVWNAKNGNLIGRSEPFSGDVRFEVERMDTLSWPIS